MEELPQEKLWAIYKTLPPTLQETIFSIDTAEAIENICKLYDIKQNREVSKIVGQVLMGLLPPELFKDMLKDKLGIDEVTAKKMTMSIEHFILNPVKDDLDALYEKEGVAREKQTEEKSEPPEKPDAYREPIE